MTQQLKRVSRLVTPPSDEPTVNELELSEIVTGSDGEIAGVVDELNEQRIQLTNAQDDNAILVKIATSLEEFHFLALESIDAGTGLQSQTLMAIEYGANQHINKIMKPLQFPSLEDNSVSDLEKTELSLEGLGDSITKVWTAMGEAAKKGWDGLKLYFKTMVDLQTRMIERLKKLRSQLNSVKTTASGNIKSSAANGLWYGDKEYKDVVSLLTTSFDVIENYGKSFQTDGLSQARKAIDNLTELDKDGVPLADVDTLADFVVTETKRRAPLLTLGKGGSNKRVPIESDSPISEMTSGILPGNYYFTSASPTEQYIKQNAAYAIDSLQDCWCELARRKKEGASNELPILSVDVSKKLCDKLISAMEQYNATFKAIRTVEDEFVTSSKFKELDWALESMTVLTKEQGEKFMKEYKGDWKDTFNKTVKVSTNVALTMGAISGVVGLQGGAGIAVMMFVNSFIGTFWIALPVVGMCLALGKLLGSFFDRADTSTININTNDPSAVILYMLKAIATSGRWFGWYTTSGVNAGMDYLAGVATPTIDYIGDSIKAHLQAAKAQDEAVPA